MVTRSLIKYELIMAAKGIMPYVWLTTMMIARMMILSKRLFGKLIFFVVLMLFVLTSIE